MHDIACNFVNNPSNKELYDIKVSQYTTAPGTYS